MVGSRTDMPNRRSALRLLLLVSLAVATAACAPGRGVSIGGSVPFQAPARAPLPYPMTAGPVVRTGGDTVEVLPRGAVAFPVIRALLAAAQVRVEVEMYELARHDLVQALIDTRRRGVVVTVIDDPSVDVTTATAATLRAAGIDVVDYPVRRQMIDHVKLLIVDGEAAVVGGINWNTSSAHHHDFDALIRGPAATNLRRAFLRDLVTCGRQIAVPDELADPAILVAATLPSSAIRPLAVQLVDSATSTLDLELYVLTDTGVVHALERARHRGVAVRVILDATQRPSDAAAAELTAAGVAVRLYRSHGDLLHAKVGVADGRRSLFGSANWTRSGFEHNHELDVEVVDSSAIAATFEQAMDADWNASG